MTGSPFGVWTVPEPASSPCQAPPGYWDATESEPSEPMPPPAKRTVLFLGTANHDRSRAAELVFNALAGRMGLPWVAVSRGLAIGAGRKPKGPMAAGTVKVLEGQGIRSADFGRAPMAVTAADFESAARVVAVNRPEHEPVLRDQFPDLVDAVEYWQVAPGDLAAVEQQILGLVTRLLGGRMDAPEMPPVPQPPKKVLTAKVGRETAARRGKGVTTVSDLPLSEAELLELAAALKQRCGTGGTVKDGRIEIQGDNRDRVMAELVKLGYQVKRAGG
jgi:predicted translation initiation factor SUI1